MATQRRARSPSPPSRSRLNSKDIPRTYSGLFGCGGELTHQTINSDLLPFELSRNLNTDWLKSSSKINSVSSLLFTYITFIVLCQLSVLLALPILLPISFASSWTYTNVVHATVTLLFLHWIKGSPNWYEQGELNAMTLWEQLSSSPDSSLRYSKQMLFVVPTALCYAACHFGRYEKGLSLVNVFVWIICIGAKLDGMMGVRIWGINRTIGIDDDLRKVQ